MSAKSPLLGCGLLISCMLTHGGKKAWELSGVPFIRVPTLFMRTPPSSPDYLPEAPTPDPTMLGVRISTHEFWGDTIFVYPSLVAFIEDLLVAFVKAQCILVPIYIWRYIFETVFQAKRPVKWQKGNIEKDNSWGQYWKGLLRLKSVFKLETRYKKTVKMP